MTEKEKFSALQVLRKHTPKKFKLNWYRQHRALLHYLHKGKEEDMLAKLAKYWSTPKRSKERNLKDLRPLNTGWTRIQTDEEFKECFDSRGFKAEQPVFRGTKVKKDVDNIITWLSSRTLEIGRAHV